VTCSSRYGHVTIARTEIKGCTVLAGLAALVLLAGYACGSSAAAPVPAERSLYADAPNGMFLLDRGWTTRPDPHDDGLRERWFAHGPGPHSVPVSIPNAFNARDLSARSFAGRVQWYRTTFTPPQVDGVTQWRFRFESVNVDATVWLNGKKIGHHRGAYLPFELPVSPADLHSGDDELVVRVDSRGSANDLPPANRPRGWWNFGGILREVYLRAVRTLDLSDLRVQATPDSPSRAQITATVHNVSASARSAPLTIHIDGPAIHASAVVDAGTIAAGRAKSIGTTIDLPGAELWAPKHPTLYQVTAELPGGQRTTAHVGVRRWSVGHDGRIRLNGAPIVLRGASFHEQVPDRGAALTPADRNAVVRELQALRANFAREHYPPHPALLEDFDRNGIVFWEQIPVWRVRAQQLRNRRFRNTALAALRGAILRDRNHASILAWSVSNETLRGGGPEANYFHAARKVVKGLDGTRLLAAEKSLLPLNDLPTSYRLLDAVGLNDYVGWYGGRTSQLPADLRTVHRKFPRQALVVTEFGAEANRAGPASHRGTYAFQQRLLATHLSVFDRTPYLSGALAWVLRDFAVRPGWTGGNPRPRPPILFKGLFTRSGAPKPAVSTVRSSFTRALSGR
jgi:beta-glucuronidase